MKFLSNISARRDAAFMVLLVWLFALASGMANACLLEVRQTHSHVAATASFDTAQISVILPGHAGAVADKTGVGESHLKGPCLKVCDDGSRSFPNKVLTVVHTDLGPAPLVMVLWSSTAPDILAPDQVSDEQLATPELPIRIRFSRLAL